MHGCERCGAELRVNDSYVALEGEQELEVTRCTCTSCGLEQESSDPILEVA